jgi:hypothetical protein
MPQKTLKNAVRLGVLIVQPVTSLHHIQPGDRSYVVLRT